MSLAKQKARPEQKMERGVIDAKTSEAAIVNSSEVRNSAEPTGQVRKPLPGAAIPAHCRAAIAPV
jgi:hypothetical protein